MRLRARPTPGGRDARSLAPVGDSPFYKMCGCFVKSLNISPAAASGATPGWALALDVRGRLRSRARASVRDRSLLGALAGTRIQSGLRTQDSAVRTRITRRRPVAGCLG